MNIALIGATGFIGSGLRNELLSRDHRVTALVTHPEKLSPHLNLKTLKIDVLDTAALANHLKGHDAVISAFSGHAQGDVYGYYVRGITSIISAAKTAKVPRLLVVGGAGSLEVSPGVQGVDMLGFPEQWKQSALGAREAPAVAAKREGSELDHAESVGHDRAGPTHREAPPRQGPTAGQSRRQKRDIARRLRRCDGQRTRKPGSPTQPLHSGVLRAVQALQSYWPEPRLRRRRWTMYSDPGFSIRYPI